MGDFRYLYDQMRNGEWSIIYNATPSVDSFFVMGAILLAYLSTETIIAKFNTPINFLSSYALSNGFECNCCVVVTLSLCCEKYGKDN